jgi:hypothetical protein
MAVNATGVFLGMDPPATLPRARARAPAIGGKLAAAGAADHMRNPLRSRRGPKPRRGVGPGSALRYTALRTMFRIMGESSRIQAADALMRAFYKKAGLESAYANAIGAVRHCIKIRNEHAHCHWSDYPNYDGLYFTELQDPARSAEDFEYWFLHVNLALLNEQKRFFDYAADYLRFLEYRNQVRTGKMPDGVIQEPTKRAPPSLHNPPDKYIPPWLVGDKRQRHLERFQEQQEGDRLPSAAQLAQEQRRQEKLAKRQADRDRNLAKRSRPDPKK